MRLTLYALIVALLTVTSASCERIAEKSEEERKIEGEQAAIQKYSQQIPQVDELQAKFAREWKAANEQTDIKAFKEALDKTVIPALKEYVAAIEQIPVESDRLEEIHAIMVSAYRGTIDAFEAFLTGLDEDNLPARYTAFMEHMDTVAEADTRYREALKQYYSDNRVRLVQTAEK